MSEYQGIFETAKGQRIEAGRRTICEVHRELYDVAVVGLKGKDDVLLSRLIPLLEEAFGMGIQLVGALIEGKIEYLQIPFENKTLPPEVKERVEKLRGERVQLMKMVEGK